ncbi:hypothetical protein GCM10017559_35190 [Streptosporangium longisporum]|uniref:Uncharacterized protein n=1 Tax=Streptosporangium longisporum TaxID=46187 RepID=A0ABP6KK47_9ACTN
MTFITRRFSVETDRVLVVSGPAPARGDAVAARVARDTGGEAVGAVGALDVPGRGSARRVRSGAASLPDGERAGRGRAVRLADEAGRGSGVRPEAEDGVVTGHDPVGAPGGGSAAPVRPMAALSGSTPASSKTSPRSTSRTPNQATDTARTVATHHTAMNPSVCRMS